MRGGCVGLALLGCSYGPELEPARFAQTTWQDAAYTTLAGVTVTAEGDIWAGDAEVRKYVTPYLGALYEAWRSSPSMPRSMASTPTSSTPTGTSKYLFPPDTMREIALPEASVRPGGSVSGFVYFERVPESRQRVTLRLRLVDGKTGRSFGTARLPFVVD